MEIQSQIDIDAPPERVWSVLVDFPRHPDWNPFIRTIEGEPRVGTRLQVLLGAPGKKPMKFTPVVLEAEPARAFVWRGRLLASWLFEGTHAFRLEPLSGGRTRFHHSEAFGGILVPVLRRSLETDTLDGFEQMNAALKAEAEKL